MTNRFIFLFYSLQHANIVIYFHKKVFYENFSIKKVAEGITSATLSRRKADGL